MLKWAVGQKNPTPGQLSSCYTSTSTEGSGTSCLSRAADRLHLARRRNSRGAIRKASIKSLRRTKYDKENQPCSTPENVPSRIRDSLKLDHIVLRDVSNSPDPYTLTPQRHNIRRRQSHPLNVISKQKTYQHSKSAPTNTLDFLNCYRQSEPQLKPVPLNNLPQAQSILASHKTPRKRKSPLEDSCNEVVDMRKPSSTLKSLSTMQIEYSPGPLTATQSLMALRQRLTSSLSNGLENTPQGVDNPLYYALNPKDRPQSHGITINCNGEQSPMLEGLLEEKSILEQVSKNNNSKIENTLVSSLSQRLEWLRLNNSFNINLMRNSTANVLGENFPAEINQGMNNKRDIFRERRESSAEEHSFKKRRDCDILKRQKCVVRRKIRRSDRISGAAASAAVAGAVCDTGRTLNCDKVKPKIQEKPKLMGLTLPLGIPSPITSEDSGLCSLGLEGIQPLSSSPIEYDEISTLTEAAVSKFHSQTDESITSSLVVNKCSPSSICSSLRKRYLEDDYESNGSRDTWNEEMIPMVKTPKLMTDDRLSNKDSSSLVTLAGVNSSFLNDGAAPSPLALVEKRSRSRRCLRFVSPGSSTCQRRLSASRRPLSLSCPRLRDGRQGVGELELSVNCHNSVVTVYVGRGSDLHRPSATACNAYVKVALVPSCERTFFRTPVQRESSFPNFNEKFSFQLQPEDLNKRILVSVWHRDRDNRKSEFLGCVSLAVKNAVKKEISGSFRLVAQSGGSKTSNQQRSIQSSPGPSTPGPQSMMARRSESSSIEEVITIDEEPQPSPEKHCKFSGKKRINDDSSFLRHLELEPLDGEGGRGPLPEATAKGGRTPFTTTKQLTKQPGSGFGFSIAWIQPPRVERVEAGQAADRAGIRPGDYVIFVDKYNVVTMSEEQVLQIIKSCGNELTLEIYRKTSPNGVVEPPSALPCPTAATASYNPARSSTVCSATTSTSLDLNKRRLHLPQVAFTNEASALNPDDTRKKTIYQLLSKEQNYVINLQFGINRFLVPLTERRDFLNPAEHHTLFQNIEELLRLTEDILEQAIHEEDSIGSFIGRLYLKRIPTLTTAYRRYCSGIKRADCLLAEKSKNTDFTRFCAEPPIPRRRPDLTTFLHKPLEHYRETLKLLQTILNLTKSSDGDHLALSRVVHEMQATFREVTAGLMEPEVEGRPLLSLQDLESRLVFTRCKPFVLSAPGRQWIFGGDLCRVEGRAVRPFWALLFTDMMVFAKVSRDRVLFITEEPLSLMAVSQAFFNIRKKANEFRLLLNSGGSGTDSPANAKCGPDLVLSRTPRKNAKFRSIALRAPTPELKAVWQNLIQRQIIYLNTTRGGTPASSPLESPDPPTTLSVGTLDSLSLRRQTPLPESKIGVLPPRTYQAAKDMDIHPESSHKQLNELIDHKCRQLGKTKTGKGSAMHLAEWMKGQLGNAKREEFDEDHVHHEPEPEICIWSQEELKRRATALNVIGILANRAESRCEEIDLVSERSASRNTERSHQSFSTSESVTTVKSNHPEKTVSVCRQCHKTCLSSDEKQDLCLDDDDFDDNWGPLTVMGMCGILPVAKSVVDPFTPVDPPSISVLPPTPDNSPRNTKWDNDTENKNKNNNINNNYISYNEKISSSIQITELTSSPGRRKPQIKITDIIDGDDDEETPEGSVLSDEPPYRTLSSSLRRFGTLNSLERVGSDDILEDDKSEEEESEKEDDEDKIEVRTYLPDAAHSIRGWTQGARSFVAEKMAIFERLSGTDTTTTVHKTSFLERYLKPSGDNHLDSPPDPGTNTSSSGRGDDEGETSGATSGEEVWGTPTSGGEFEEELVGESSALSFMESPHGSIIGTDDDTEQLMEDLLISLPMLAVRAPGIHPRRRLEPLPEEDDTESSSAPCSPKPLHELKADQGRGSTVSQQQHHDNCPRFGSSLDRPLSSRKDTPNRPRIGTIDRALGIHSDEEQDEPLEDATASPSLLHRLGLRRNREEGRKSNKLTSLFQRKFRKIGSTNKIDQLESEEYQYKKKLAEMSSPTWKNEDIEIVDQNNWKVKWFKSFRSPSIFKKFRLGRKNKESDLTDAEKEGKSSSFRLPNTEDIAKRLPEGVYKNFFTSLAKSRK